MAESIQKDGRLRIGVLAALFALLLVVSLVCTSAGRYAVSVGDIAGAFYAKLRGLPLDSTVESVIFNLRLPRLLLAIALGAGLSCAGAAFQSLFANPLATPDTLGVTAGASVGAVVALMLGWNMLGVQLLSLAFGLFSVVLTVLTVRSRGRTTVVMLVLSGVVISALWNAVISILKYTADPTNKLPQITYWLMGSLSGMTYGRMLVGLPFIFAGITVIVLMRWRLNILTLSDDEARAAGIDVQKTRMLLILASAMITASCVSMCGQVGWVGLLVPHCARMIAGSNNRFVIPISLFLGSMFMVVIDTLARSLTATEMPISVLTAVIGAPFFVFLLRQTGGKWS